MSPTLNPNLLDHPPSPEFSTPEIQFHPLTNIKTITTWHISPSTAHKIRRVRTIRVSRAHAVDERIRPHASFAKFGAEVDDEKSPLKCRWEMICHSTFVPIDVRRWPRNKMTRWISSRLFAGLVVGDSIIPCDIHLVPVQPSLKLRNRKLRENT